MRSEEFFLFLFLFLVFPIKQVFPAGNSKRRVFGKKMNLLKLFYPTYRFVKEDNSKD